MLAAAALDGLEPARAAAYRRVAAWPHWVWPLAVCALFSAAGLLAVDDYAVTGDTVFHQRILAIRVVDFVISDTDRTPARGLKFYGAAFEVLPLFAERILGLHDTRSIYLSRHLITHLFFIVGGFCCYLLAHRMTGSRLLALFAMLLFLLHPRMYGHSYFNSKDIPFLSMFVIALLGIHWAFQKGTVMSFMICGAAVAILVNLRIMGIMLLPAVLAMRACDLYYAAGWAQRRRVMVSGAAFVMAVGGIYYASMPYMWADPSLWLGERITTLGLYPVQRWELFQGRYVDASALPSLYLPVWIGITTPPWALLLAGLGAVGTCWRAIKRWGDALRNTELRFALLLLASAALPVIMIIAVQAETYTGWRHTYFIWAPLCLLAMLGLRQAGNSLAALTRHSGAGRNPILARVGVAALAALGLAVLAVQIAQLHPYQHLYFNLLVDRTTPEYLKTQYETDYYHTAILEGNQYILDNHYDEIIQIEWHGRMDYTWRYLETFSESERRRFRYNPEIDADYYVISRVGQKVNALGLPEPPLPPPSIYAREVYSNTIMNVATPDLSRVAPSVADTYREIYRAAVRREPAPRGGFDFYINDRTLTLVNENCPPGTLHGAYELRVYPVNKSSLAGLPHLYRRLGYVHASIYGVRFDGKCLMQATLPDYAIRRVAVVDIGAVEILSESYLTQLRQQYAALRTAEPALHSVFAVYMQDGALRYIKGDCNWTNVEAPFFLHTIPSEPSLLPAERREYGYGNYDFHWIDLAYKGEGVIFEEKCMATVKLPDYEIHGIRTGQHLPGEGRLWGGEFYTEAGITAQASRLAARAVGEPAAQDFFNVYHGDGALTYIRTDCAPADTEALFYLHLYPAAAVDLPEGRRQYGFGNADFEFGPAGGVQYAGRCLVSAPLPDYAIDRIHTGQYSPETGRLWAAEFTVADGTMRGH